MTRVRKRRRSQRKVPELALGVGSQGGATANKRSPGINGGYRPGRTRWDERIVSGAFPGRGDI